MPFSVLIIITVTRGNEPNCSVEDSLSHAIVWGPCPDLMLFHSGEEAQSLTSEDAALWRDRRPRGLSGVQFNPGGCLAMYIAAAPSVQRAVWYTQRASSSKERGGQEET